ncbi:MAG TPA: DUF6531 domain-containing protein [Vicinamibacterales bacterium]|nr:DUF6531 domain-containing protein [Vicinamibacterales bacterium]
MRKLRNLALAGVFTLLTVLFGGPACSGGLFLPLTQPFPGASHDLPPDYQPLHKGAVDLSTGLYVRENEDLVVDGTPALILRRTYLSGYRVSKQFGIGATHNGEEYLIGDGDSFQWVSVILASGSRINFRRTSAGASLLNAMYLHDETPTEWHGAQLGWTGLNWALRKRDGSVALFQSCGPASICSIIQSRDSDGHITYYRRNPAGQLLKIDDGGDRWIAFEYDAHARISRAQASTGRHVRYEYDARGRLAGVVASDGAVHRYTYTGRDELATIEEPGTSIENLYEGGRCVRQVNRYPDSEPYTFDFTYHVENGALVRTDTKRSDGTWTRYVWGEGRYAVGESLGRDGLEPAVFTYDRDAVTKAVTALTVTCPDRSGRPLRHSSIVRGGNEDQVKRDLLQTHCHWNRWQRENP